MGWGRGDREETAVAAAGAGRDETGLFGPRGETEEEVEEEGREGRRSEAGKRFPIKGKKKRKKKGSSEERGKKKWWGVSGEVIMMR